MLYTLFTVVCFWRLIIVFRHKLRVLRTQQHNARPQSRHQRMASRQLHSRHSTVCSWKVVDAQLIILTTTAVAGVMFTIAMSDPQSFEGVLSRTAQSFLFGLGGLLTLIAAGLVVRFFVAITATFHEPTRRILRAFDVLTLVFIVAIVAATAAFAFIPRYGSEAFGVVGGVYIMLLIIGASVCVSFYLFLLCAEMIRANRCTRSRRSASSRGAQRTPHTAAA